MFNLRSTFMKTFLVLALVALIFPVVNPVEAYTLGGYQSVSFSASNFGASASMTYTNNTQVTYRYIITTANQMHLMVELTNGTISGTTTNAFLTVKIPEGRTPVNTNTVSAKFAYDNGNSGTWVDCYVLETAGSNVLLIRQANGANFTTVTNAGRLAINTTFEVNEAP